MYRWPQLSLPKLRQESKVLRAHARLLRCHAAEVRERARRECEASLAAFQSVQDACHRRLREQAAARRGEGVPAPSSAGQEALRAAPPRSAPPAWSPGP